MTISFRGALMMALLGVLLLTMLVVGATSYVLARFAVEDLGAQVLTEASERIEQNVQKALEVAASQSTLMERLLERGLEAFDDHERLSAHAYEALSALSSLSYLSLGLETGKYWHAFRDDAGSISVLWLLPLASGERRLYEFYPRPGGEREVIRDLPRSTRVPPYERPYYVAAKEAGRPIWTETYVFLGTGEALDIPGVSRATPIYTDREGNEPGAGENAAGGASGTRRLVGVLTADFDLHALSRFLRAAPVGERGIAFIVEERADGKRRVIAHPDAAHPDPAERLELTEPSPTGEGRITVRADRIGDPRVPLLVNQLLDAAPTEEVKLIRIDAPDGRYVGGYRRLQGEGAPPWTICMLLPREEIIGDVQRMAGIMLSIAGLGVLVVVVLAVILSKRVAQKLRRIADETGRVARFHLDRQPVVDSRIGEIHRLAVAVEEMKTGLRSFQKYVPADLVRLILESGEEARLGGSRKTITIYFSDIAEFTSISEQLEPEELVELLAEYLEAMTREMMRAGGTVDKYIGDAIMAFWGAPKPVSDHALVACRTALGNQRTLAVLRDKWTGQGRPPIRARIGLHTGEAIVGNFGSESRLDFTAIGDSVNLASRLEGLNRHYGTEILMSDATREQVRDQVVSRPLDKVAVKGKQQGIVIHELMGLVGEVSPDTMRRAEVYGAVFHRYLQRDWAEAVEALDAFLREEPGDVAAALLRERCLTYIEEPPPPEWTGVHRMQQK